MKIKLYGGTSGKGWISFTSDRFVSTARCVRNKESGLVELTHEVQPIARLHSRTLNFLELPFMPKSLCFLADQLLDSTSSIWLRLGFAACLISVFLPSHKPRPSVWVSDSLLVGGLSLITWYMGRKVGAWHGAEHMAVMSCTNQNSYEPEDIAKESPVCVECGSRYIAPLVLVTLLFINTPPLWWGINSAWFMLGVIEILLWVDYCKGLGEVPFFRQATAWLQRHMLTRPPGPDEIHTASLAMQKLFEAHSSLEEHPS